ncbi:MAG: fatty acyl-AMP ligase [Gemmatimonadales bacterium]
MSHRPAVLARLLEQAAESEKGVRFLDRAERVEHLGYDELHERACDTARGLADLGVRRGDRVAIVLPTCPAFYDAFFGCARLGAVPVPLYPPVRLGRLGEYHARTAGMLRGCRARIVLSDARTSRVLGRAVAAADPALGLAQVDEVRRRGSAAGRPGDPGQPVGGGFANGSGPEPPALIQHSSGTTGTPRPVRLSGEAVLANLEVIRGRILAAYPESDGFRHAAVSWLPLYHDMGLIGCVLTALAHPADLTLIPPEAFVARPAIWLRALSRYGGTVSGAPNFAYSYCAERVDADEIDGLDLSGWRIALTGAEPVTAGALQRFARRFAPAGFRAEALTPVYGLAEATLAVTFSDPALPCRVERFDRAALAGQAMARPANGADASGSIELVSVGRPLEGVDLRVTDDEGREVAPDVLGRVEVGGRSLFEGYDDAPPDPGSPGPWFDTGDTGFVHGGELFLYGRAKDVIILRGRKYAPQEIEAALNGLPGIRRGCVAAVGVPAEGSGEEELVVLAERVRDAPPSADGDRAAAIRRRVTESTGLVPGRVVVLEPGALPRTSSGKIRRAEAQRRYRDGELSPPAKVGALSLALEMVRSRLALRRLDEPEPGGE